MSTTPSGNLALSLFDTEPHPPSPIEATGAVEISEPLLGSNPAPAGEPVTFDNLFDPPPAPLSPSLRTRGLSFIPCRGQVLWCDFQGYRPGEIGDKVRPAIVVSPWELNKHTVCVVPVTRAAAWATPLDVCLPADRYPFLTPGIDQWVLVQRITHVGRARLDRMRVNGRWRVPSIASTDLTRILTAVASIFALPNASEQACSHEPFAASLSDPIGVAYGSEQLLHDLIDADPPEGGLVSHVADMSRE